MILLYADRCNKLNRKNENNYRGRLQIRLNAAMIYCQLRKLREAERTCLYKHRHEYFVQVEG